MTLLPNLWVFDFEVFAQDWLFVGKNAETGERIIIHNDNDALVAFFETNPLMCGFNSKHYDDYIAKAIIGGLSPELVKAVNDEIIVHGKNGWEIPLLRNFNVWFDSFDLMDDMQKGISLKSIEALLGIPIEETEVDFNIQRALTD